MVDLLRRNVNVFAWDTYEATGLDPKFICHHLNVNPSITSKRQLPWCLSKEHVKVVKSEVTKLKQAGAIKEVFYLQWLANTVVVKKKQENGGCVWILQILTRLVLKILSLCLG